MKWFLIVWLLHADGLPTLPITITVYATKADCETHKAIVLRETRQLRGVCREGRPVPVGKLEVVK